MENEPYEATATETIEASQESLGEKATVEFLKEHGGRPLEKWRLTKSVLFVFEERVRESMVRIEGFPPDKIPSLA